MHGNVHVRFGGRLPGKGPVRNEHGTSLGSPPYPEQRPMDIRDVVARSPGAPASPRPDSGSAPAPDARRSRPNRPRP